MGRRGDGRGSKLGRDSDARERTYDLRPAASGGYTVNMRGQRHKRHGGGLGGTLADTVLATRRCYSTDEQFLAEQALFAVQVRRQQLLDQTLANRVLGRPRRRRTASK